MRLLLNILWFVLSGFWMGIAYVIGIPFGIANFKLIPISLLPFGRDVVTVGDPHR